ncbi:MAG: cobaltochelatase subunit CobN [Gemmatimonadales bacterium]|nr:cobaltochelatase subunit CobN [Gemmatimonadales bacterium]
MLVTLDGHRRDAFERARLLLAHDLPGLDLRMHVGADWAADPAAAERCRADLRQADFVLVTQLFQEEMAREILPVLRERREHYDAILSLLSVSDLVRLSRLGKFSMADDQARHPWSPIALLKKLRGSRKDGQSSGERQMQMVRTLPSVLRFIPGVAQDLRIFLLSLQYWLSGSDVNLANLVRLHINRYASGPRAALHNALTVGDPELYPDEGVYHPSLAGRGIATSREALPARGAHGTVGLLVGRSYLLAGNTAHYDAVIAALEGQGLTVVPAFAAGLDSRPAIDRFFRDRQGAPTIDALVSLTGFSLVGGPAYNDQAAAQAALTGLDVPYLSLPSLEFQTIEEWERDPRGLNPLQATLQVAIPELDGAIAPLVFGGRGQGEHGPSPAAIPMADRIALLARRVERLIRLRRTPRGERKLGIILFNFPPNAGNTGSAAYLAVFPSLQRVLASLKEQGYRVDLPESVDALREAITEGNAKRYGAAANVHTTIPADDHVRREPYLAELEQVWGPAPGKQQADGRSLFVLGAQFGNVFVGVQPAFGWEGDPMRLLFEGNFAPTHAFSAFYRWLRQDFAADAVLHFGTHGALEFMPGKQVGLSSRCWPERLIDDLPNVYLYASNNSSEGTLAKRRGAATLVSYLTPPLSNAGLYRKLAEVKATLDRYRAAAPEAVAERASLAELLQKEAAALELAAAEPAWPAATRDQAIDALRGRLLELEYTLIPLGLHVVGEAMPEDARRTTVEALAATGCSGEELERADRLLAEDHEVPGLLRALDARYVPPAPGGDLLRTPAVLPTGRNLYGFDPYRVPSGFAVLEGRKRAAQLLETTTAAEGGLPETVAMVLWGTDNMKTEGVPLAIALALLGAAPRFDDVGRLVGARLLPLEQLGRPRVDVVLTLSGIFRDLLPLQTRLLAEAALLAARAEEPAERNFVRKHALAHMAATGADLETAALRVFSNADGAYGSNVNLLLDNGRWTSEDELAEQFLRRKGFAYGVNGQPRAEAALFERTLATAQVSFQNLDSVELGTTDIDQYVESLGGMNRLITRARGSRPAAYIGDHTGADGKIRTLEEQVALETRTRLLNPKWYEAQLAYGYEGVRNLSGHVTTTFGWSATGSAVPQWVYTEVTETFVLDPAMRDRLAALNPSAAAGMAQRLLEANDRGYWQPDPSTLDALRQASADLDDRLEGVVAGARA